MYSIITAIVGTPLTKEVCEECDNLDINPGSEDGGFYELLYNGGGDGNDGYLGVELCTFDVCNDFVEVASLKLVPTKAQLKKAKEAFDTLPTEIQKVAPPVGVYFVFHSS